MNILTFDIEEWFHILDNESTKAEKNWNNYEERIYSNMDKIFNLLENSKKKATFFIVGWIATKYPDIVKKIDKSGYEIGSHSNMHQLIYNQSYNEFKTDLEKSVNILESITGKKVKYFRAPGFSVTEKNKWVFEVLFSTGITHDCSIFPAGRAHGGFPSYNYSNPSIIDYNGIQIKEFPINTHKILTFNTIFSGGGYFRFLPYTLIKEFSGKSDYIMTYFHPRDFDPHQPIIRELNYLRKFKSYVGLSSCYNKLEKYLNDFDFNDLSYADSIIDWKQVKIIKI